MHLLYFRRSRMFSLYAECCLLPDGKNEVDRDKRKREMTLSELVAQSLYHFSLGDYVNLVLVVQVLFNCGWSLREEIKNEL